MAYYIVKIRTECIKSVKVYTNQSYESAMDNVQRAVEMCPGLGLVEPDERNTTYDIRLADENEDIVELSEVPTSDLSNYMPPVKLGDTVYFINDIPGYSISEVKVSAIHISSDAKRSHIVARPTLFHSISKNLPFHKFNVTWFVDKEKARRAIDEQV